ncbi:hypothetical protein BGW41_003357 [Actinomortierella wolfii]|nr:hypothetical protein BGW41_003357 [Actinomortierella wolfii]
MLRSLNKALVLALACLLVIYTVLLTASSAPLDASDPRADLTFSRHGSPSSSSSRTQNIQACASQKRRSSTSYLPVNQKSKSSAPQPESSSSYASITWYRQYQRHHASTQHWKTTSSTKAEEQEGKEEARVVPQKRYLVYVPYAGATNQLISIWHATMIAKHLNRTLLLPNLSPNVHVQEPRAEQQEEDEEDEVLIKKIDRRIKRGLDVPTHVRSQISRPPGTRWSRFFDIDEYSRKVGVEIEELDDYLIRTRQEELLHQQKQLTNEHDRHQWAKRHHEKRWLGFWGGSNKEGEAVTAPKNEAAVEEEELFKAVSKGQTTSMKVPIFAQPIHCYSEGGYGMDRRMDVTGKQFMARYGIHPKIRPTPYLNPKLDNGTIWARWRVDKVVERYQQPAFTQGDDERILCLSHVYRLLPGGRNRAWVEFGQHFKYTKEIEDFVDEALVSLLKDWKADHPHRREEEEEEDDEQPYFEEGDDHEDGEQKGEETPKEKKQEVNAPPSIPPFVGLHLRRGDFERHCLGIASPADPNGWNRCYPSTQHVISLLSDQERAFRQAGLDFSSSTARLLPSSHPSTSQFSSASPTATTRDTQSSALKPQPQLSQQSSHPTAAKTPLPVLVLSNERDPRELAKSDAQGWIRVDHGRLGTVERFGGYGPIMIDGALLARASLLVGVEYSTYFRTASLRAETWHAGRTLFVT